MAPNVSPWAEDVSAIDAARARGQMVVGIAGAGVPVELVLACGAAPVRLVAGPVDPTPNADALIGAGESAAMRALFERMLDGRWSTVDLLVVTRQYEWLYYYLKEAVRSGAAALPPLHLHDFVFSAEPALRDYNRQRLVRLAQTLERRTGVTIDADTLRHATVTANRRRTVLRDIQQRRNDGTLSGTDAVRLIAGSHLLPVDRFVSDAAATMPAPPPGSARLLLLASQIEEDGALHRAIEAAGVIVVAEDSEWGARSAQPDLVLGDDPYDAMLDDLLAGASGPDVSPRAARLGWAEAALHRDDIAGVIFAIPPQDTKFGWDYPSLRDHAAAIGLPAMLIRDDPRADPAAITVAVADFAATLAGDVA